MLERRLWTLVPAALALMAASASAGGNGTAAAAFGGAKAAPAAASGAVETLLAKLRGAQTAAQAGALVEAAKLDEAEMLRLDRELAKPEWAAKLAALKLTIRHTGPATRAQRLHVGESAALVIQRVNRSLASALRLRIDLTNRAVSGRLGAAPGTGASLTRLATRARRPPLSVPASMNATMLGTTPHPEWPATITSVEPASPVVGQPFTIVGSGFGNARGGVLFVVGEGLFEAEVTGWTSGRVTARVPFEALPWDSMADIPDAALARGARGLGDHCLVWVRLADGRLGAGRQIWVSADLQLFAPSITAVTPEDATPGGRLLVEGTNFGDQPGRDGRVSVMFGSYGLSTLVREWRDGRITLEVPESVVGVGAMTGGIVTVTNYFALTATRGGLSFSPAEEATELPTRTYVTTCHPAGHPLFCWFGDSHEVTPWDLQLANGWRVEEVWVDVHEIGVNAGAYFDRQASPGDTHAVADLVVWCDGLSRAEATPHMVVKGPRGTNYR